jgi:CheY-like chemotaxis protein
VRIAGPPWINQCTAMPPPEARDFEAPAAQVLVVDDDPDMLDLARMILEPRGYLVDTAADGRLGLAAAQAKAYDVVVLDITMPIMDGIELGNTLRSDRSTSDSMIIVHTALNEAWVRSLFAAYDLFLSKPDGSNRLADGVSELLHERQEQHAAPQAHP